MSKALTAFFHIAQTDVRLTPVHISIYFVLFRYWIKSDYRNPISITRKKIMQYAKVKSTATYHKCIAELHKFGYIHYAPSYHPAEGSSVILNMVKSA